MTDRLNRHLPADEAEACAIVTEARANGERLAIEGAGSKTAIGQIVEADAVLSSAGLSGIVEYNPGELVILARAGTPLADINAALAENNQALMFEPADWGALLGSSAGQTIGGIAAANLSGPRRISAGAARDSLLGVRFINGRGEAIKNGGKVMKNVTGLDLVKLMAGSWGSLGLITEVAFKVLPKPEAEATLAILGADDAEAATLMAAAMGTSAEVSGAAHLPAQAASSTELAGQVATLLRVEGFPASVDDRFDRLKEALATKHEITRLDGEASQKIWAAIANVTPFADGTERPVWRVSAAPMAGHKVASAIAGQIGAEAFYDWQGGQVWLRMTDEGDAHADIVRGAVASHGGGHATLIRGSRDVRRSVAVFHPERAAIAALTEKIAASIDPDGVFNCGRRDTSALRVAA